MTVADRTALGSFLRATQARCQQLCRKETLQYGIAFYSERFATLPEACQLREVWIPDVARLPEALAQADAWFESKGLRCLRWAPAEGQRTEAFGSLLRESGFSPRRSRLFQLAEWRSLPAADGVRVLPARAMRAAFRDTFTDALPAEAASERLDDPQWDMFVAVRDKQALGRCGLYQVGDIAQVVDFTAAQPQVGRTLLHTVLALAKRLAMPMVLADAPRDDAIHRAMLEDAGFVSVGEYVEYDREGA